MRRWFRLAFLVAGSGLAVFACQSGAGEPRAISVQLHLHGPFSEGAASIDSHSYEASDVGCDVLWWSEHDFRLLSYGLVARFGFEAWQEELGRNELWSTPFKRVPGTKGLLLTSKPEGTKLHFVRAPGPVKEGEYSLRLLAQSQAEEFEALTVAFGTTGMLQQRPLASGVRVRLAVLPHALAGEARIVVEALLSEHAPRAGLALEPRVLSYEISSVAEPGQPYRLGAAYRIPMRCDMERWNELEFDLTRDAVRGFPESPGEDNAFAHISLGVATRKGGSAAVFFDDLRILQRVTGPPVYARQAELLEEVGELYPRLTQLQGLELSPDSHHLNLFCEDTPLPDYEAIARATPPDPANPAYFEREAFYQRTLDWAVAETHARGGLVSYNHPFGRTFEEGQQAPEEVRESNEAQLAQLLAHRAQGADLLEVGYRKRGATLDEHLWLWDHAALAGLCLVGIGVSDSHGGKENRWRGQPNNFVSWIYARSPSKRDLIEGLRASRVFFGDIERFDGTLDLLLDSGERMGASVVGRRGEVGVTLLATGTKTGQRLVVVESGARTHSFAIEGAEFRGEHRFVLPANGPAFVRIELHDETGPVALSNPIHFLPR